MTGTMRIAIALAAGSTLLSGCFLWTTAGDGDRMDRTIRLHEERIDGLAKGVREDRQLLREELARAKQSVAELEQLIERATSVVTRNSADTGARVEELQRQLSTIEGQLAELQQSTTQSQREMTERMEKQGETTKRTIEQIARKAGVDMAVDESQIPADRNEHYAQSNRAYQTGEHSKARGLLREYVRRYAQDEQADNCQYMIGASYLAENQPARALGELRRVITDWPRGDAIDEALFDMGDAFYRLHACTDARSTYDTLVRTQPRSTLARRARDKLREIGRAPRGYCTS
jgi:TolA-binding protein